MPKLDASSASCHVLTFKDGLLAAVAHDLKIDVTSFVIDVAEDRSSARASFDASSLRTEVAMKQGAPSPGTLSDKDKRDIDSNIQKDVLEPRKHPQITFASSSIEPQGEGFRVRGGLEIKGKRRDIEFTLKRDGARLVAQIPIHQPDFGVKPFTAVLGTLKIKPDIQVQIEVPAGVVS